MLDGDRSAACMSSSPAGSSAMHEARVFAYRLPEETFEPWDQFCVSRETVEPLELVELGDLSSRARDGGHRAPHRAAALPLWDEVIASTLDFSGIRLRNATLRHEDPRRGGRDDHSSRPNDLLERAGHEVCAEASDGEEAVELARAEQPDLAIMDVKMPRLDGIEAARRILDERPIPIVMLTAYGQEELVSRAVEAGVFGYLVKPFREQDLLPAIATARARHEELQAVRDEAESLAEALAARKVIERAKGLLMEKEKLTEQEAFARLRKASQASQRPLKVIAEAVVATLGGRVSATEHPNAALTRRVFAAFGNDAKADQRGARRDIVWRVPGRHGDERRVPRPPRGRRVPPPHRPRDRRDVRQLRCTPSSPTTSGRSRSTARGARATASTSTSTRRSSSGSRRHVEGRHRRPARRRVRCVLGLSRSTRPT